MNALTHDIVTSLGRGLARLPGATSISLHKGAHWTYLLVLTSTDASVESVSACLDLGPPTIKTSKDLDGTPLWWRCATSERRVKSGSAFLQIDVHGPVFCGGPLAATPWPGDARARWNPRSRR